MHAVTLLSRLPVARLVGALVAGVGALVLLGWAVGLPWLKTILQGAPEMKANTALGLAMAGSALLVSASAERPVRHAVTLWLALLVTALGVATASQDLFGWHLGIDELLFRDPDRVDVALAGRMSLLTACCFTLIGLALALLGSARLRLLVWMLSVVVLFIGATALLAYLWNVYELIAARMLPTVAVHTALCFTLLGIGTLFASRERHVLSEPSLLKRASIEIKVAGGFAVVILLLLIGGGVTYRASVDSAKSAQRVSHIQEVRARLAQRYATMSEAESAVVVFLLNGTSGQQEAFHRYTANARRHAQAYAALVEDDPGSPAMRRRLDSLEAERLAMLERIMGAGGPRGPGAVATAIASPEATATMDALRDLTGDLDDTQAAFLLAGEALAGLDRQRALLFLYLTLAGAAGVFMALAHTIRREMLARSRADESVRELNADLERRVAERTALLQQSSQLYRHTLDNMLEGCQVIDFDLRYRYVNAAAARQNRISEQTLVGRTLSEAHPGIEASEIYRIVTRCMEDRVPQHREHEYVHPDGVHAWFQISVMPAPDGVSLFSVDITERKSAEAEILAINAGLELRVAARTSELVLAREAAEAANRAKSAFLATMSHEIRTPMNGVVGMVEVLFHSGLPDDQADAVRTIRASAFSLLRVIDDILDFSKIEAGRLDMERVPVPLQALVESVCEALLPMAADNHVELGLFVSPGLPAQLWSDPTRLRQVLFNLAGNAIKFSVGEPHRHGQVAIRVESHAGDAGTMPELVMRFTDNGIGMAPETLGRLFAPFTQAETSTTRRFGGTGLGLTICKRLVTLMGGTVQVDSVLGKGTTFTVRLPLHAVPGAVAPPMPDLDRVDCVVIGADATAQDLRVYLEHAGATVHPADDLAAAVLRAGELVRPVIVQNICRDKIAIGALREAFAATPHVHHVLIERGLRRGARIAAPDVVAVDGDCLRRSALLRAVAVAAGRQSPDVFREGGPEDLLAARTDAPSIAMARAQGRLILVAEDDDVNQKVILRQIEMLGYAAEIAHDGEEALRLWEAGPYALLLTDLHMPVMDGYNLADAIRQKEAAADGGPPRRMPILALTANALRGEAIRAQAAGMDEYLTKPLQLHLLQAALTKWLPLDPGAAALDPAAHAAHLAPLPAVDVAVLERLVGGDAEVVRELLSAYLASAHRQAAELRAANAADDVRQIGAIAHRLKSSSRAVGAAALGDLCAELENACHSGARDAIVDGVAAFEAALRAVDAQVA